MARTHHRSTPVGWLKTERSPPLSTRMRCRMIAARTSADRPEGGDGPEEQLGAPDPAPPGRRQPAVREEQHGEYQQHDGGQPGRLHEHGEMAQRQVVVAEAVAQAQVQVGVGAEREQPCLADQQPPQWVARLVAGDQHADQREHEARRDQDDGRERVTMRQDRQRDEPRHQSHDDHSENARVSRVSHRLPGARLGEAAFRDRYGHNRRLWTSNRSRDSSTCLSPRCGSTRSTTTAFSAASAAAHAIGKTGLEAWTTDRTPAVVSFLVGARLRARCGAT